MIHTDWVHICLTYEGLLGAHITQDWSWEPHEWEGIREPVPGHGEKLILYSVKGTSGSQAGLDDISWNRGA